MGFVKFSSSADCTFLAAGGWAESVPGLNADAIMSTVIAADLKRLADRP
jgi:hypothetical protein